MRKIVALLLLVAVVTACGGAAPQPTADPNIRLYNPPQVLTNFQLIDQHNQPFKLSDLSGKFAVITFGFTHCPDVCPINLANYKVVKQELGDKADQVNFVFISVDGERDTPEAMLPHLKLFDETFIGLTGDEGMVRPVANAFNVRYEKYVPEGTQVDYLVNHTATWFLVNESGTLIRAYAYGMLPETIAADMLPLLQG